MWRILAMKFLILLIFKDENEIKSNSEFDRFLAIKL